MHYPTIMVRHLNDECEDLVANAKLVKAFPIAVLTHTSLETDSARCNDKWAFLDSILNDGAEQCRNAKGGDLPFFAVHVFLELADDDDDDGGSVVTQLEKIFSQKMSSARNWVVIHRGTGPNFPKALRFLAACRYPFAAFVDRDLRSTQRWELPLVMPLKSSLHRSIEDIRHLLADLQACAVQRATELLKRWADWIYAQLMLAPRVTKAAIEHCLTFYALPAPSPEQIVRYFDSRFPLDRIDDPAARESVRIMITYVKNLLCPLDSIGRIVTVKAMRHESSILDLLPNWHILTRSGHCRQNSALSFLNIGVLGQPKDLPPDLSMKSDLLYALETKAGKPVSFADRTYSYIRAYCEKIRAHRARSGGHSWFDFNLHLIAHDTFTHRYPRKTNKRRSPIRPIRTTTTKTSQQRPILPPPPPLSVSLLENVLIPFDAANEEDTQIVNSSPLPQTAPSLSRSRKRFDLTNEVIDGQKYVLLSDRRSPSKRVRLQ